MSKSRRDKKRDSGPKTFAATVIAIVLAWWGFGFLMGFMYGAMGSNPRNAERSVCYETPKSYFAASNLGWRLACKGWEPWK